jgi:hypothetical protein
MPPHRPTLVAVALGTQLLHPACGFGIQVHVPAFTKDGMFMQPGFAVQVSPIVAIPPAQVGAEQPISLCGSITFSPGTIVLFHLVYFAADAVAQLQPIVYTVFPAVFSMTGHPTLPPHQFHLCTSWVNWHEPLFLSVAGSPFHPLFTATCVVYQTLRSGTKSKNCNELKVER